VGDHRWNFELALCGLFRAFSRMTPPKRKPGLVGKGSPARPTRSMVLLQICRRGVVNSLLAVIGLRLRTMTRSRSAELPCHWLESV
jgi:hypothetical protein